MFVTSRHDDASFQQTLLITLVCLGLFFFAFNFLEASIPSIVSRSCGAKQRGTAMGFYSTSQFAGAFVGGLLAGFTLETYGTQTLYISLGLICLIWFVAFSIWLTSVTEKSDI